MRQALGSPGQGQPLGRLGGQAAASRGCELHAVQPGCVLGGPCGRLRHPVGQHRPDQRPRAVQPWAHLVRFPFLPSLLVYLKFSSAFPSQGILKGSRWVFCVFSACGAVCLGGNVDGCVTLWDGSGQISAPEQCSPGPISCVLPLKKGLRCMRSSCTQDLWLCVVLPTCVALGASWTMWDSSGQISALQCSPRPICILSLQPQVCGAPDSLPCLCLIKT